VYRWEFEKGNRSLAVAVNGPLIVDDVEILIRAAIDGVEARARLDGHVGVAPAISEQSVNNLLPNTR
jgi:hypothetical protein